MAKPGTTKSTRERIKKQKEKKRRRQTPTPTPTPAPMPNRLPDPQGRTTARIKYNKGGEAMPKAKPC